jgi:hypothetical protein
MLKTGLREVPLRNVLLEVGLFSPGVKYWEPNPGPEPCPKSSCFILFITQGHTLLPRLALDHNSLMSAS